MSDPAKSPSVPPILASRPQPLPRPSQALAIVQHLALTDTIAYNVVNW